MLEIIYYARAWEDTSCPAMPTACCQVYHKYFIKLNRVVKKKCVVKGSNPFRVNGSSVVECTNMARLASLRFDSAQRKCFDTDFAHPAPIRARDEKQSELSVACSVCKSVRR